MSDQPNTNATKRTKADAQTAANTVMTPTVLKALAEISQTLGEATADIDQNNYGIAKSKISTARSRLTKALQYFGYKPPKTSSSNR